MVNFEDGLSVKDFKTRPLPLLRADTAMCAPSHVCEPDSGASCPHVEWSTVLRVMPYQPKVV